MDRFDFYFEQLVTQADMDEAFDFAEAADQALQSDNGYVGIAQGQDVAEHFTPPDLTVDIAAGVARDPSGQRIFIPALQTLDLSVDSNSVPTAVANVGNEKWLSVFVAFDRALSDPRVDGNGMPLQYRRAESFQFIVDQGAESAAGTPAVYTSVNTEPFALANGLTLDIVVDNTPAQTVTFLTADFAAIGAATAAEVAAVITAQVTGVTAADNAGAVEITTDMTGPSASVVVVGGTAVSQFDFPSAAALGAGGPARPALRPDAILLSDVLLRNGTSQIFDAPGQGGGADGIIDVVTRRQMTFVFTGAQFVIKEGTITEFATALATELQNHVANTGASHPGSAISYDPTVLPVPSDWSDLDVSGDLQAAVDAIVNDLSQATGVAGASLVGSNPLTTLIGASDVEAALTLLQSAKASLAGGNTFTGTQNFSDLASFSSAVEVNNGVDTALLASTDNVPVNDCTLLLEIPSDSGSGQFTRVYWANNGAGGGEGFYLTRNAAYNNATNQWARDVGGDSYLWAMTQSRFLDINFRDGTAASPWNFNAWFDAGTGGRRVLVNTPAAGEQFIFDDDGMQAAGPIRAYAAIQDRLQAAATYDRSVPVNFNIKFPAAPSSATQAESIIAASAAWLNPPSAFNLRPEGLEYRGTTDFTASAGDPLDRVQLLDVS